MNIDQWARNCRNGNWIRLSSLKRLFISITHNLLNILSNLKDIHRLRRIILAIQRNGILYKHELVCIYSLWHAVVAELCFSIFSSLWAFHWNLNLAEIFGSVWPTKTLKPLAHQVRIFIQNMHMKSIRICVFLLTFTHQERNSVWWKLIRIRLVCSRKICTWENDYLTNQMRVPLTERQNKLIKTRNQDAWKSLELHQSSYNIVRTCRGTASTQLRRDLLRACS